ncbi:hypothetical protein RRG08_063469 [Elysia crispata]|uniref:Uncharacterized protein n=1 Tax=Elysia crispata TaxID=231223 RepID=A0AAE1DW76_9GAST|nr:hypothetical protein RRG08_063469 [Elysia crispata]
MSPPRNRKLSPARRKGRRKATRLEFFKGNVANHHLMTFSTFNAVRTTEKRVSSAICGAHRPCKASTGEEILLLKTSELALYVWKKSGYRVVYQTA